MNDLLIGLASDWSKILFVHTTPTELLHIALVILGILVVIGIIIKIKFKLHQAERRAIKEQKEAQKKAEKLRKENEKKAKQLSKERQKAIKAEKARMKDLEKELNKF